MSDEVVTEKSRMNEIRDMVLAANTLFDNFQKVEFVEFLSEHLIQARICSACGRIMVSGYCIGDGESYYCTDECLHTAMTEEEYQKLFKEDAAYWTDWES